MKKIYHKLFNKHEWKFFTEYIAFGRPSYKHSGDYLPEDVEIYKCKCGMEKIIYKDNYSSHFGAPLPDEIIYR